MGTGGPGVACGKGRLMACWLHAGLACTLVHSLPCTHCFPAATRLLTVACPPPPTPNPTLSAADFPVVYASGMAGIAGPSPDELADDLEPLFDMIVREVAPPTVQASTGLRRR